MNQLIKLVRTYRLSEGLAERLNLGDAIFRLIEPQLRLFVFGMLTHPAAEDVLQDTLRAVAMSLGKLGGKSTAEFWGWCYRIARNKVNDHPRVRAADKSGPMPPEELWRLVDASSETDPLSSADRLDLNAAMTMLHRASPECYEYLWRHFIRGLDYSEIAEEQSLTYDNVRMRVGRCLDRAQLLVT